MCVAHSLTKDNIKNSSTNKYAISYQFTCIFYFFACARASFPVFFFLLPFLRKQDNVGRHFKYFPCYNSFIESCQQYFKCNNKCEIEKSNF